MQIAARLLDQALDEKGTVLGKWAGERMGGKKVCREFVLSDMREIDEGAQALRFIQAEKTLLI